MVRRGLFVCCLLRTFIGKWGLLLFVLVLWCLAAKKAFRIPLEEADKRAVDLVAERPHSFTTTPKQFADYLGNFHTSVPEITVAASAHKLSLQSFLSGQVNQGDD
jgi:hypothetical protein